MARRDRSGALALALAFVVGLLAGCSQPGERRHAAGRVAPPVELSVVRGDLVDRVLLTGELEASKSTALVVPRTEVHELAIRWMAEDGAEVKAGDKVLEFDNSAFVSRLEEQRQAVISAENDLRRQQAANDVAVAQAVYTVEQRRVELAKAKLRADVPEDTYPRREYQERQLALHKAEVELDRAEDDLAAQRKAAALDLELKKIALTQAKREVSTTEQSLDVFEVEAPRDGLVVVAVHPWLGRKFQIGDSVHAGFTILEIPALAEMQVQVALSDVDDGRVAKGMHATCTLDAYPDKQFPGTVTEVGPVATELNQESLRRIFKVVVALDQTDRERMLPGMSVKVEIDGREAKDAVLAPRGGLDLASKPPRARLADGGSVEVELGLCTVDACEVKKGLEPGMRLRGGGL